MHDTSLPINRGNRHPVDQLADVRAEIKKLEAQETDLKAQISAKMGSRDSLGGDEFIAVQTLSERKGGLDEKKIAEHIGVKSLDPYRKPSTTFITLRVERRVAEVA